jgi:3-oxoacyl-[acyl-carrier protein] reductase
METLDFTGRNVLVVGGSSGIGNGIAQAFRARGASVTVWGTRKSVQDYATSDGSDLTGLSYVQVDVSDEHSIEAAATSLNLTFSCCARALFSTSARNSRCLSFVRFLK